MSTNGRANHLRGLIPKLIYPGLTPTERKRLLEIHDYLVDGPLTTDQIVDKCAVVYDEVSQVLNYGSRQGTLAKKSQHGYKGRGRRPQIWSNVDNVIESEAGKPLPIESPLDLIDESRRAALLEMDPAKCEPDPKTKKPVTAHNLYYVAELCAAVELFPDLNCYDLATKLAVEYSTFRGWMKLAERIGALRVDRPERNGHAGRPHNKLANSWPGIENLRTAGHVLSPSRSKKKLIDLTPKKNRCTPEQRRWLAGLTPTDTKLAPYDHQAMTQILFPSFGTSRITTYRKLAEELRCGTTALEKPIHRLKKKGWMELEEDAGGDTARESEFKPLWDRVETAYKKRHRRAKGKTSPSTNGHAKPKKRAVTKPAEIGTLPKRTAVPLVKLKSGPKVDARDQLCERILAYQAEHRVSRAVAYKALRHVDPKIPDRTSAALEQLFRRFRKAK